MLNKIQISEKDKKTIAAKRKDYNPALITGDSMDGSKVQKKSWTSSVFAQRYTDTMPTIEQQLGEVKRHDIIDVGRRDEEAEEIFEGMLSDGNNKRSEKDLEGTSQLQLEDVRSDETTRQITESSFEENSLWREVTWEGDDIKIYRDINARQKENAKANQKFYNNHKELTDGGKGTVSS